MRVSNFQIGSCAALLWLAVATSAAAGTPDAASMQPYAFCVSGLAANGKVYLSPVFPDPLHDVQGEFASYLAATYRYTGDPVHCYSLAPESQAQSFRTQIIEILHWREQHDILAIDWTPGTAMPKTPSRPE